MQNKQTLTLICLIFVIVMITMGMLIANGSNTDMYEYQTINDTSSWYSTDEDVQITPSEYKYIKSMESESLVEESEELRK